MEAEAAEREAIAGMSAACDDAGPAAVDAAVDAAVAEAVAPAAAAVDYSVYNCVLKEWRDAAPVPEHRLSRDCWCTSCTLPA
eukprot:3277087-Rhodomonas_salina.1